MPNRVVIGLIGVIGLMLSGCTFNFPLVPRLRASARNSG